MQPMRDDKGNFEPVLQAKGDNTACVEIPLCLLEAQF